MQKIKLHINDIKPQQHYLTEAKLKKLTPIKLEEYGEIFVLLKDDKYFCVDGHHRLYLMAKQGVTSFECLIDTVDQDSRLYHELADEAEELGLHTIFDLEDRIVSNQEFLIKWVGKCQEMLRGYQMKFVKLTDEIKNSFITFNNEFEQNGERVVPFAAGLHGKSFEEHLHITMQYESGELPDPTHVPSTTFYLMDGDLIIGAVSVRHYLNDYLLKHGGHIGYGVTPSERGKGYATKLLEYGNKFLNELGVERALLTCDKENPASRRVIEKCGGVLENEIKSDKRITQRFWIELT